MNEVVVIAISAWLAFNFLIVPAIGFLVTRRPRPPEVSAALDRVASPADAYVSILLSRLVMQACRVMGVERMSLLVRDGAGRGGFIVVTARGMGEDVIGRRVVVNDVLELLGGGLAIPAATPSGRQVVLCAPSERPGELEPGELQLISDLADLCAAAVDHLGPNGRPEPAVRACAIVLALVGEARDSVLRRSAIELPALTARIGSRLGLDPGALIELQLAACVYDVASAGLPSTVALPAHDEDRPPPLRADPASTAEHFARVPGLEVVTLVIGLIGERWDGHGHPHRLRGERIPLASRVLGACSAIQALTTEAPRGPGAPMDAALREIQAASGTVFDPTVVAALSNELMGEVPPLPQLAPSADWGRADALYSIVG